MLRATLALLAAAAIAAVVFLVPAQASTPKLVGTVGPGYTITLKKGANGKWLITKSLTGTAVLSP